MRSIVQYENNANKRIRGFDGLRAAAFLMVFASHKIQGNSTEALGSAGVWLFFVLSGFLITRILADTRERIDAGSESFTGAIKTFYVRRSARIMPVYYFFLFVLTILSLANIFDMGGLYRQLSYCFYLTNFYIERNGWASNLDHLWSLAVEEQFYLLFAPLALLISRRGLAWLCVTLVGLSLLVHFMLWSTGAWSVSFDVDTAANLGLLALGGIAGLSADRSLPRFLANDVAIATVFAIYVVLPLAVADMGVWLLMGRVSGLLAALLLLQIVQYPAGRTVGLLEAPLLQQIGLVSYGAYLFHPIIDLGRTISLLHIESFYNDVISVWADLILTLLVAKASSSLFERPVKAWIRSRYEASDFKTCRHTPDGDRLQLESGSDVGQPGGLVAIEQADRGGQTRGDNERQPLQILVNSPTC